MKIIDERKHEIKRFGELKVGDTFTYCGFLYLKINEYENINAVLLPKGIGINFNNENECFPVECKLIIEREL